MKITGVYRESGVEAEAPLDNYFVASRNPVYIGVLLKPSRGIWEYLKNNDSVILKLGDEERYFTMKLKYRIEVGENSIFFLNPEEEEEFGKFFFST